MEKNESAKFVGVVEDCFKRKSRNNNDYMRLVISDEKGFIPCLMANGAMRTQQGWRQSKKLDDFIVQNGGIAQKGNIAVVVGQKGEDILFADRIAIMDQAIYMKLSDLK